MNKFFNYSIAILFLLNAVACTATPQIETQPQDATASGAETYPYPSMSEAPLPETSSDNYPPPVNFSIKKAVPGGNEGDFVEYPTQSAFSAYNVALLEAKNWDSTAELLSIPRYSLIANNLGSPQGEPGWFFVFKKPNKESLVEFYIEVINNEVSGHTEVQQINFEKPTYTLAPIQNLDSLIDSEKVVDLFLASDASKSLIGKGTIILDLELEKLEGMDYAVWMIYDTANVEGKPLLNINASNGEIVKDPFDR